MKLSIPFRKPRDLTVICVYAFKNPFDVKEQFYDHLDEVIKSAPQNDKLILGDFSARVGRDYKSWDGVLGRHGVGKINDMCAEHGLCNTNTLFTVADRYKTTWMHPR